jgi:tetratricopeptide (TPR) repeat protein
LGALGLDAFTAKRGKLRFTAGIFVGLWAINTYASFWVLDSESSTTLLRVNELQAAGRQTDALQILRTLAQTDPRNVETRSLYLSALVTAGQTEEAAKEGESLLRDNPGQVDTQLVLTSLLIFQHKTTEALEHARQAVQLAPGCGLPYERLVALLLEMKRFDEAIQVGSQGLGIAPFNPDLRLYFGTALLLGGRASEADVQIDTAIHLSDNPLQTCSKAGAILDRLGQFDAAAKYLSIAVQVQPGNIEARFQLAGVLEHQNQIDRAIEQYMKILQIQPDSSLALNNLAWIRATHPKPEFRNGAEAVRLAERACQATAWNQALVVRTLAAAYAETGQFEKAVSTAQKACAIAASQSQTNLLARDQELLHQYQNHQPCREDK